MKIIFLSFWIVYFILFCFNIALASTTDGIVDATNKYAWGEDIGWVNFGTATGNVHITDSGLTGYAWNENYGWINLNPTSSGVKNDGNGVLSGQAWGEGVGWINFTGVTINSSGYFTGHASGIITGQINFGCANCKVQTDWRPKNTRNYTVVSTPVSYPSPVIVVSNNKALQENTSSTVQTVVTSTVQINSSSTQQINSKKSTANQLIVSITAQLKSLLSQAIALTSKTLQYGSKGENVRMLQRYLIIKNTGPAAKALAGHGATPNFGILTKKALIEFQKANNISPAIGIFGRVTREYIKNSQ